MKLVSRILTLLVLASATVFYSSCGGDDDNAKSETDQQLEKLNGTWVIQAATDVTQDSDAPPFAFTNMQLVINASAGSTSFNWTTSGRPELGPWDAQGTFQFGDPVASVLKRNDNVTINYNVTDTELIMTFTFNNSAGYPGRAKSVEGDWHFEFTKK
jgi:hypothetical protein